MSNSLRTLRYGQKAGCRQDEAERNLEAGDLPGTQQRPLTKDHSRKAAIAQYRGNVRAEEGLAPYQSACPMLRGRRIHWSVGSRLADALARLELRFDAFETEDVLAGPLLQYRGDEADLAHDAGNDYLLQRVDAPRRLLDLLADLL